MNATADFPLHFLPKLQNLGQATGHEAAGVSVRYSPGLISFSD
jgi:hypothetical protein